MGQRTGVNAMFFQWGAGITSLENCRRAGKEQHFFCSPEETLPCVATLSSPGDYLIAMALVSSNIIIG